MKAATQKELIDRGLDMEEGNIEEHRNYLTLEEEKRKKARVVKLSVEGPLLRWISRKEEVTVLVQPSPPAPPAPAPTPPAPAPVSAASTLPLVSNPYIHYRYPQQHSTSGVLYPGNPSPYPYTTSPYSSLSSTQHLPSPAQQSPLPQ